MVIRRFIECLNKEIPFYGVAFPYRDLFNSLNLNTPYYCAWKWNWADSALKRSSSSFLAHIASDRFLVKVAVEWLVIWEGMRQSTARSRFDFDSSNDQFQLQSLLWIWIIQSLVEWYKYNDWNLNWWNLYMILNDCIFHFQSLSMTHVTVSVTQSLY